jgi:radical SAM superfamily enzyme YgiQ (UPF0313 family)
MTLRQVEKAVRLLKKNKIITVGFFMLGNIGENSNTMIDTITFAQKINLDYAQFFILIPFPGTPVFKYFKQKGYLLTEDWRDYTDFNRPVFETENVSRELLLQMYRNAYRQFYFRPSYILKRMYRCMTNYYEFKIGLKGISEMCMRALKKER